jgi:hypothetical protein
MAEILRQAEPGIDMVQVVKNGNQEQWRPFIG